MTPPLPTAPLWQIHTSKVNNLRSQKKWLIELYGSISKGDLNTINATTLKMIQPTASLQRQGNI